MKPPFTIEQFLGVFKIYNQAVFPMQIVLYLMGAVAIYLVIKPNSHSDKIIGIILSFFWLWMGIVYHIMFFALINKAAYLFGAAFILQGILLLVVGVVKNKLSFKFRFNTLGTIGLILVLFSMFIYPMLSYILNHLYPAAPTFGLPCPTTIFTFGLILLNTKKPTLAILIIPFVWSIIGFAAVLQFGIFEDASLLVASVVTISLLMYANRTWANEEKLVQQ